MTTTIDRYWKYNNPDPSTARNAAIVSNEIFAGIVDRINKRGWDFYQVRPDAIIVRDLVHETIRQLADMFTEQVKRIDWYEQKNSGDIRKYFGSTDYDSDSGNEEEGSKN